MPKNPIFESRLAGATPSNLMNLVRTNAGDAIAFWANQALATGATLDIRQLAMNCYMQGVWDVLCRDQEKVAKSELVREAVAHLDVAYRYSAPSDDKILLEHIRVAKEMLDLVLTKAS